MIDNIYFSESHKRYYYSEKDPECFHCESEIKEVCFYKSDYGKRHSIEGIFCLECFKKLNSIGIVGENKILYVIEKKHLPRDSMIVIQRIPRLSDGKLSCYDIDAINQKYEKDKPVTHDRTRLSNRNLNQIPLDTDPKEFKIGSDNWKKKDRLVHNVDSFFDKVKSSEPMIEHKGKKLLEVGK